MDTLTGQVAIVTGAARGLGRAIAQGLAEEGATVVAVDVVEDEGKATVKAIQEDGGEAMFAQCDLRKEEQVKALIDKNTADLKRIDILVNNAGIGKVAPLWETPTTVWDDIMAINVRGPFLCCKYVVPGMLDQKKGKIINISSAVGKQAQPLLAAYAVSKASNIAMTVALAKEVADHGITVNAVCPGPVDTPWWNEPRKALAGILDVPEDKVLDFFTQNKQIIKIPLKPENISRVVCWLASSDADLITGQAISIDGGHEFPTY